MPADDHCSGSHKPSPGCRGVVVIEWLRWLFLRSVLVQKLNDERTGFGVFDNYALTIFLEQQQAFS